MAARDSAPSEETITFLATSWAADGELHPPMRRKRLAPLAAADFVDSFIESAELPWTAIGISHGPYWVFGFDRWWWVIENVGDLRVFVDPEAEPIDLHGCYEICDPFWATPTFLPWWGASDRAWARRAAVSLLAGSELDYREYPQGPPEPGWEWADRHTIEGAKLTAYTTLDQRLPS